MKKFMAIMLALVLALGMTSTAFAATINVSGAVDDEEYSAYKIFDVTADGSAYAYTIAEDSNWFEVVTNYANSGDDEETEEVEDTDGMTLTESTVEGVYSVTVTDAFNAKAFAANLIANADDITADGTVIADDGTAKFENLDAGYYLVDSSLGALCALHTNNDTVDVFEKNSAPSITKGVSESQSDYAKTADADMNQTLYYQLTVNTGTDGDTDSETGVDDNYVIEDTLDDGLSYNQSSVVVKVGESSWTLNTDYTVEFTSATTAVEDNPETEENEAVAAKKATMKITLLAAGKLAGLAENTDIIITYSAKLEDDADVVVGGAGNGNKVELTYKEQTSEDSTTVYTYRFDIVKINDSKEILSGAQFKLYSDANCTTEVAVVYDDTLKAYRPVDTEEGTAIIAGNVEVTGLDAGDYWLKEIQAPTGYNPLANAIKVTVSENNDATVTTTTIEDNPETEENEAATTTTIEGGVQVVNSTGSKLPSTGGMGTTIFYVVGGMMMAAAFVLLITKRKVASEK